MTEEALDSVDLARMPLMEHLTELRRRLIISMVAIAVGMVVALLLVDPLYGVLTAPLRLVLPEAGGSHPLIDAYYRMAIGPLAEMVVPDHAVKGTLAITASPLEGVYTYFRVALMGGLTLAFPVVAGQVWGFIAPGLYASERRTVFPLVAASTVLFLTGMLFAYLVLLPMAFPFFLTVLDAEALLSVNGYLTTVIRMLVTFGACFQLPVLVWFGARLGWIDHHDMIGAGRYAVVGVFVVAAFLTPPEVLTQIALAIPLILLYGAGIPIAWLATTKVRSD